MKINEFIQTGAVQPNRGTQRPNVAPAEKVAPETTAPAVKADLHPDAKVEAQVFEGAKLVFEALPEARDDRVELAKKRLSEGFYNRPEILDQIASKLVADPEARPSAPLSLERQAEIKQRLASGYYDSPEVLDQVAGGLADDATI